MQDELKKAVEEMHGVPAAFLEQVPVVIKLEGRIIWQGAVYTFRLSDSPLADKCYAWYSQGPEKGGRRVYSVLHKPPIDSPEKAVRSSIDPG